jgi:septal ring factor EnvC (AmiA/AmiB activator)
MATKEKNKELKEQIKEQQTNLNKLTELLIKEKGKDDEVVTRVRYANGWINGAIQLLNTGKTHMSDTPWNPKTT